MSRTIRRIGASKLAIVSECQTPAGKHIALKEFNRQSLTPLQHQRIFGAAERWKKLAIAGLVPYLEVSPQDHQISMELFDRSAAMRLREGPSDPRLVLHTVRGVLSVLVPLHEQGLVHCNLKPTNVFFDTAGRARLSDGLLIDRHLSVDLPPLINLKYMAPEQASSDYGPLSPASDLYCLGLLALELLAGERFARAFQGIRGDATEDDLAWSQWHASSLIAPTANLFAKGCPAALASVIARLVAKQPNLRYVDARQALQDLPQDIAGQTPATPSTSTAGEQQRAALAAQVIPRPSTGIVLAIASGLRAGEMIGSNENELMLGFDHDCFVRFSHDHYPTGGSKVLLRRGPQGWYALRVSGDSAFVNQRLLEEKCPLRSGDIVRLSSRGPDIQFTMQSGGVAIRALVERFLPSPSRRPLSPAELAAASSAAAAAVGPRGSVVSAPARSETLGEASLIRRQLAWLDPRAWNKTLRNFAFGIVGAVVIILVSSLLTRPSRSPVQSTPADSQPQVGKVANADVSAEPPTDNTQAGDHPASTPPEPTAE